MLGPPDEEVGINIDGGADERPEPGQEVHIELQHREMLSDESVFKLPCVITLSTLLWIQLP